ncbi:MAG: riboflavin biosynthesis protein RibF, partial [Clostridiales bacterium]|nr:riboflavin biosynthesis protein RibF [Clostridiales bacterium]
MDRTSEYGAPLCVALGFFDCVHRGHKALLETVQEQARTCGAHACVVTFSDNPYPLLRGEGKEIFTYAERLRLFENTGIECVLAMPFDRTFMQMSREAFLRMLTERFAVRGFVCGHDYRFGVNAEGTPEYLRGFCEKNGIMCNIVPQILQNGARISSTRVRAYLANGDIESAKELLGHAYFVQGRVEHGRGVGKLFGFPTANLCCEEDKLLPACGVYATVTEVAGVRYTSVTNVGDKPTFGEKSESVESMLVDFSGDLYGKTITV